MFQRAQATRHGGESTGPHPELDVVGLPRSNGDHEGDPDCAEGVIAHAVKEQEVNNWAKNARRPQVVGRAKSHGRMRCPQRDGDELDAIIHEDEFPMAGKEMQQNKHDDEEARRKELAAPGVIDEGGD